MNVDETIAIKIDYILENLEKVDDFYFERSLFVLTNFAICQLTAQKNKSYLKKYVKSCYRFVKNTNNNFKNIIIMNSLLKFTDNLSERKQQNCAKFLIRLLSKAKKYELIVVLEIIFQYISKSKIFYEELQKYLKYFNLKVIEKE